MTGVGEWTLGQYSVRALIGIGGMARVYRGYQPALTREVAIKVLSTQDPQGPGQGARQAPAGQRGPGRGDFLRLFESEARTVAKLAHPYIVPIYDFGVDHDWAYFVMEYITHGSVREELVKAYVQQVRVNLLWTLEILDQVATALDFAHLRGVAHLDIKPGNMLLRESNMVVLSDFGVARILAERSANGDQNVMGTPQYMAPEQTRPNAPVDGRADIYALGVVLYECVTGRLPFMGENSQAIMLQHRNAPVPLPTALEPKTPKAVEEIILKAMAKDPAARYQRAGEMAQALRQAHGELAQAQAISELPTARRASPTMHVPAISGPPAGYVVATPGGAPAVAPPYPAPAGPQPAGVGVTEPFAPPTPGLPGAPGQISAPAVPCFRCGTLIPATVRYCVICGYDRASTRASADTFAAPTGRPLRCRLIFQNGPFAGRALTLHQGVTTIGRGPGNDLLLNASAVSRQHARLSFARGSWYLEDVGSSNGVYVNRKRLHGQLSLQHGDIINFGNVEARFELVT
jgi:serine/threonine-protein kinase